MKDNVLLSVYRDTLIISQIQFFLFLVDRVKAVSPFLVTIRLLYLKGNFEFLSQQCFYLLEKRWESR